MVVMGCRRARALGWPCWQVTVKSSDRTWGQNWYPCLAIPARRAEGTRGTPWLLSRKELRCQIAEASFLFLLLGGQGWNLFSFSCTGVGVSIPPPLGCVASSGVSWLVADGHLSTSDL